MRCVLLRAVAALTLAVPCAAFADDGFRLIHSFASAGAGGWQPNGLVSRPDPASPTGWALYGTSNLGGRFDTPDCHGSGCGIVFKLVPPAPGGLHWTDQRLYVFAGGADGAGPRAALTFDSTGHAYGTTELGGGGCGTVFRLTPPVAGQYFWTKETLLSLGCNSSGGVYPWGPLTLDATGAVLGTTASNGQTAGTVFRLSPPAPGGGAWTRTVLHSLDGLTEGTDPFGGVVRDPNGNLFGATTNGYVGHNNGTVFELSPPAAGSTAWRSTTLYAFSSGAGFYGPRSRLLRDADGTLYGSCDFGGPLGYGGVFRLRPPLVAGGAWRYDTLFAFDGADGISPGALAHLDGTEAVYGVTRSGLSNGAGFDGTVFKLEPPSNGGTPWRLTVLHRFSTAQNGESGQPAGALVRGADGVIYGTQVSGGGAPNGVAFKILVTVTGRAPASARGLPPISNFRRQ